MKELKNDNNGIIQGILASPVMLLIMLVLLIVLATAGGLIVIWAPNIAAAAVLILTGFVVFWKVPAADPRMRVGVLVAFVAAGVCLYLWGDSILGVLL